MTSSKRGMLVQGTLRTLPGLRAVAIHRCRYHSPGGLVLNILQKASWPLSIPAFASFFQLLLSLGIKLHHITSPYMASTLLLPFRP